MHRNQINSQATSVSLENVRERAKEREERRPILMRTLTLQFIAKKIVSKNLPSRPSHNKVCRRLYLLKLCLQFSFFHQKNVFTARHLKYLSE